MTRVARRPALDPIQRTFTDPADIDPAGLPGPGRYRWAAISGWARHRLERFGPQLAPAELRWIVEAVGAPVGAEHSPAFATARQVGRLIDIVEDRIAGRPLQYALGSWAFRDFDVHVDERVLIPRPETEQVADVVFAEAKRLGIAVSAPASWPNPSPTHHVADLGTGSGVLAIAMVRALADATVWATDIDVDALAVARANLAQAGLHAGRMRLAQGSWWEALPPELAGHLSIVVSNPPYISLSDFEDLADHVRNFEPTRALVAGTSGLDDLDAIIRGAPLWLSNPGVLICEIGQTQGSAVVDIAGEAGFDESFVLPDLTGRDRVLVARVR